MRGVSLGDKGVYNLGIFTVLAVGIVLSRWGQFRAYKTLREFVPKISTAYAVRGARRDQ